MRKILLASSAMLLAASPAVAGDLKMEVSGYADFRAGFFDESDDVLPLAATVDRKSHDFETEVKVIFDVMGKGAGNFEYGARVSLTNRANNEDNFDGGGNSFDTDDAFVYMGGNWGKVILGDARGASDLFVYAPVVGLEQVDGSFSDFTSNATLAPFFPAYIDNEEVSTKATYYTPVVSGFQIGASFIPQFYDNGQNVTKFYNRQTATLANGADHPYGDVIELGAQYKGEFNKVNVTVSGLLTTGDADSDYGTTYQDFTAYGVGAQVGYAGFTVGGSYYDAGDFFATVGQNRDQDVWSLGATYEMGKAGVGVSYVQGQGYTQGLGYVEDYNAIGVGAEYNWMPGLVTAADAVFFDQDALTNANDNDGYVFLLSQRVNF